MRVGFDHAPPREADLVIGADGLHSRVRQLVFGPDARAEVSLGYQAVAFEVEGYRPRDELVYVGYGVPGRQIFRFSMRGDIPYAARTGISSSNSWNSRVNSEAICCLWRALRLARPSSMAAVKAS